VFGGEGLRSWRNFGARTIKEFFDVYLKGEVLTVFLRWF